MHDEITLNQQYRGVDGARTSTERANLRVKNLPERAMNVKSL
jgi:hypothetical protein